MKKRTLFVFGIMLCVAVLSLSGTALAAGRTGGQSANAGIALLPGLFDTEATVFFVEYEKKMKDNMTLFGRAGMLDYDYDDGWYSESGDGPGFDVGMRYYLLEGAMKALYLGGSIGIWQTDWTFNDNGTLGSGDSTAIKIEFEVGHRIPIPNAPIDIVPTFRTGSYISVDDSCRLLNGNPCTNESEIGIYGVLGVSVGFQF